MLSLFNIINKKDKCPLSRQEKKLLRQIRNYKLTQNAFQYYKYRVKNNYNDDYETARRKLIRNIVLGREGFINKERPYRRCFYYGNLTILLDENTKEIVWLDNKLGENYGFKVDQEKKEWLNKELGINTYEMRNKEYIMSIDIAKGCDYNVLSEQIHRI